MTDNLERIIAVEGLVAAQGVEMRGPLKTSPRLAKVLRAIRDDVPALGEDRALDQDIELASKFVHNNWWVLTAGKDVFPMLEPGS